LVVRDHLSCAGAAVESRKDDKIESAFIYSTCINQIGDGKECSGGSASRNYLKAQLSRLIRKYFPA